MKNDPLVAKLYNKMQREQNEYRAWLLAQPPEEILNHAYEYSSREDILIALENASLRPAQLRALLESQAPLTSPSPPTAFIRRPAIRTKTAWIPL